jgi:hypothetical protein
MLLLNSSDSNYKIDEYKINVYENIEKYNYKLCTPELELYFSNNISCCISSIFSKSILFIFA